MEDNIEVGRMKFNYCLQCGNPLVKRVLGDEGEVPFCLQCKRPFFQIPYPAILTIVVNEEKEVALLRQNYLSQNYWGGVAGFIKIGESLEEAVVREVEEELGLFVHSCQYIASYPHYDCHDQDVLLMGYLAFVKKRELKLSKEVDQAQWFSFEQAEKCFRPDGKVMKLFLQIRKILGC